MNNLISFQSESKIQLGETFMHLASGMADIAQIAAESRTAREAAMAREDAYARRHRILVEITELLTANYYQ
jgi:hypothetical protein